MVYSKNVLQSSVPEKRALQKSVLQKVVMEIGRDRQNNVGRMDIRRALDAQMNIDPAKSGRLDNQRRRQEFVQPRKFYRSRQK